VWRLITSGGITIANSVDSFDTREAVEAAIASIKANASSCDITVASPPPYR
jgi:uncharacterized protein YegP (UPF0339 family)